MNWVLYAEQACRNSLQSQKLPLPMHQGRACCSRLSRNPLQRLSRSNYARVEPQTFGYAITPIFQLFQPLILFAGRPGANWPNVLGPF